MTSYILLNTVGLTILTWFNNLLNSHTLTTGAFSKVSKLSDMYRKNHDIFDIFDILIFGHNARNVTGGFMTAVDRLIQHSATFASHSSVTVTAKQTSCEIHSTVSNYKLPPMFH